MADDTGALCNNNNNNKNHLQLTLEQPAKYGEDIETGGTFPDTDEENFDEENEGEEKGSDEEEGEEGKEKESKVPPLYQVEPGCTPLSCYSAILTFIVMTMGVFWLLLISPPKNSIPVPIPASANMGDMITSDLFIGGNASSSGMIYDWDDDGSELGVEDQPPLPPPSPPEGGSVDDGGGSKASSGEDSGPSPSMNERTIPKSVVVKDSAS